MIEPIADELLECLRTEIAKVTSPPAKVGHRVGDVIALMIALDEDECCKGIAWVRFVSAFPSATLGEPLAEPLVNGFIPFWSLVFEIGAARCAPTGNVRTNPSVAQWNTLASRTYEDGAALRRAACCLAALPKRKGNVLLGILGPLATEGGCAGVAMQVTARGPSCEC